MQSTNVVIENIGTGYYNNRVVSNRNGWFHIQEQLLDHTKNWTFYKNMCEYKPARFDTLEEAEKRALEIFNVMN